MAFFCLCTTKAIVGDDVAGFKVDTYLVSELDPKLWKQHGLDTGVPKPGVLPPEYPMGQSFGHRQFLASVPNKDDNVKAGDSVREHFPNVDLFFCPLCKSGFVRG